MDRADAVSQLAIQSTRYTLAILYVTENQFKAKKKKRMATIYIIGQLFRTFFTAKMPKIHFSIPVSKM